MGRGGIREKGGQRKKKEKRRWNRERTTLEGNHSMIFTFRKSTKIYIDI